MPPNPPNLRPALGGFGEQIRDSNLGLHRVLAFLDRETDRLNILQYPLNRQLNGEILSSPRGENGFGYDPIFEVNGKTLAEMTLEEKSEISHRKNATIKMVELLNEI